MASGSFQKVREAGGDYFRPAAPHPGQPEQPPEQLPQDFPRFLSLQMLRTAKNTNRRTASPISMVDRFPYNNSNIMLSLFLK